MKTKILEFETGDNIEFSGVCFLLSAGTNLRTSFQTNDAEELTEEAVKQFFSEAAKTQNEEPCYAMIEEIVAVMKALKDIGDETPIQMFRYKFGPESLRVNENGDEQEFFPPDCFILQAKTKDVRVKGDGALLACSFCRKDESGEWVDVDIDQPMYEAFPPCFKTIFKLLQNVSRGDIKRHVELYKANIELQELSNV